jgi:hypothetical protein
MKIYPIVMELLWFKYVDIYRNNGWIFDKRASCVQTIYNIRCRDYYYTSGVVATFGCTIICIHDGEVGIKNHLTVSSFSQELYKIHTKTRKFYVQKAENVDIQIYDIQCEKCFLGTPKIMELDIQLGEV